jgi:hypothetical protein
MVFDTPVEIRAAPIGNTSLNVTASVIFLCEEDINMEYFENVLISNL